MFQMLAPQFRRLHPIKADSPQECSEITAHLFASLRFDTTYRIPSYRRWLDDTGHLDAYRFHKRFLQHLQHQAGGSGRWVLKCPDHIFALGAIRTVYPDANLVFVHRDPVAVLASVARLTEVLRRPFSRRIDRLDIGREDSERWLTAAGLMIAAADEEGFASRYFTFITRIWCRPGGHSGGALPAFRAAFSIPTRRPASGAGWRPIPMAAIGGRRARLEDYGLDPAREHERFARYMARFGIRPEQGRRSSRPGPILGNADRRPNQSPANS